MRRAKLALAAGMILLLLFSAASAAQAPELPPGVELQVTVDREGDTIGDPVRLTVVVTHPASADLLVPPPEGPLGDLEAAAPSVRRDALGDTTRVTLNYETRAFATGALILLPPALSYRSDGVLTPIQPPPQAVDVRSLLPDDGSLSIRGLKPPETIEGPDFPVLPVALGIGVPLALLAGAGLLQRRRRRPPAMAAVAPAPNPAEIAGRDLERIGASGLLPQAVDEFCARINGAVRGYLASRYALPAPNLTAAELGDRLARAGADAGTVQRVRTLCQACDEIAYAGAAPNPDRVARYLDLAQAIVHAPVATDAAPAPEHWAPPSGAIDGGR